MIRTLFIFLAIVFARTTAHSAPFDVCTTTPKEIGGFPTIDILNDSDLREAVRCAVNRSGISVIGENSFQTIYHVSIPKKLSDRIQLRRRAENDPFSNRINTYQVKFKGIFQKRLATTVRCDMTIDFREIHKRSAVVVNLLYCQSSEFGLVTRAGKPVPLESWAAFTFLDGKK